MHSGRFVFSQIMYYLPLDVFRNLVARYYGNKKVHKFSCLDQFYCMAFAQLTYRESLRDIEACLGLQAKKLLSWTIQFTRLMPLQLICASRYFLGQNFVPLNQP